MMLKNPSTSVDYIRVVRIRAFFSGLWRVRLSPLARHIEASRRSVDSSNSSSYNNICLKGVDCRHEHLLREGWFVLYHKTFLLC